MPVLLSQLFGVKACWNLVNLEEIGNSIGAAVEELCASRSRFNSVVLTKENVKAVSFSVGQNGVEGDADLETRASLRFLRVLSKKIAEDFQQGASDVGVIGAKSYAGLGEAA